VPAPDRRAENPAEHDDSRPKQAGAHPGDPYEVGRNAGEGPPGRSRSVINRGLSPLQGGCRELGVEHVPFLLMLIG
jgi:hypothetical protein